jgi:hypothetical protein
MDINIEFYKKIADNEIINPQWTETKRFLEVNNIKKIDSEFVYERCIIQDKTTHFYYDRNDYSKYNEDNFKEIIFFYEIEDQHYFFGIGVNMDKNEISFVYRRNSTYCYLSARSLDMTLEEMVELTKLKYSAGATKGEKTNRGRGYYDCSWIEIKYLNERSYEIEESLSILLDELEKDKEGIKKLAESTDACINICKYQYVSANAGIEIDRKTIKRLNELNLKLFIDIYCEGKYIK